MGEAPKFRILNLSFVLFYVRGLCGACWLCGVYGMGMRVWCERIVFMIPYICALWLYEGNVTCHCNFNNVYILCSVKIWPLAVSFAYPFFVIS